MIQSAKACRRVQGDRRIITGYDNRSGKYNQMLIVIEALSVDSIGELLIERIFTIVMVVRVYSTSAYSIADWCSSR